MTERQQAVNQLMQAVEKCIKAGISVSLVTGVAKVQAEETKKEMSNEASQATKV